MIAAVLFARQDSAYKEQQCFDVYDIERDARTFCKRLPVLAHPPCRAWGMLSHMAKPREDEKQLAFFALAQVRLNGGVLEHPSGSRLWQEAGLPNEGLFVDEFGGFTIEIDQYDFGHVANKPTKLYICGIDKSELPQLPKRKYDRAAKSITGQVPNTKRATQYEREYTPPMLIEWLKEIALKIRIKRYD